MAKSKDLIDKILEDYGEKVFIKEKFETVSTGSIAIDVSTGVGGIPHGRYTEIWGPESGGKTTLSLSICKSAIDDGLSVLYVDVENNLYKPYVVSVMGESYKEDKMTIVQPLSAEDSFEMAEAGIDAGRDVIIFDSVAAIAPLAELKEDDYEKSSVGLAARKLNQFLRKTVFKIREKGVAFVFTNQVRSNIGSFFGGYVTPGGHALNHFTSLRIYMAKGGKLSETNEEDMEIGHYINFTIKKNKMARPYRSAETVLVYGKGIDTIRDVLKFGSLLGVIQSRGPYYSFQNETIGQGMAKSVEVLEKEPERLDKIIEMCYNVARVEYPPVRKGENE